MPLKGLINRSLTTQLFCVLPMLEVVGCLQPDSGWNNKQTRGFRVRIWFERRIELESQDGRKRGRKEGKGDKKRFSNQQADHPFGSITSQRANKQTQVPRPSSSGSQKQLFFADKRMNEREGIWILE